MDLTHCKHNVPMEVECMACESDEANNAGAAGGPQGDPLCACGETRGPFPMGHMLTSCLVGSTWVPKATFTRPVLVLVSQLMELQEKVLGRESEVARLVQTADDYRLAAEKAQRQADEWRSAALSLARAVGSYAETGKLS